MKRLMRRCHGLAALVWALLGAPALADTAPAACPPVATAPSATRQAQAERSARDRGLLWQVTRDGRTSWLYGTIHIGRYEWTLPGPQVRAALQASDVLALELDPLDPRTAQALRSGMAPNPRHALGDELARRLATQMQLACLPEAMMTQVAPEMIAMTLMATMAQHDGLDAAHGIDVALARRARASGLPVVGLESPEAQLALLISPTQSRLQASLDRMLRDLEDGKVRPMMLRIARTWETGDERALIDYADWCDCANTPDERAQLKVLLNDRNPALADGIDALHAEGRRVFAAVGSLHLVGPEGVPAQLARRGYSVRRIEFAR